MAYRANYFYSGERIKSLSLSKGLITSKPSYLIPDDALVEATNFEYDEANNRLVNVPAPDLSNAWDLGVNITKVYRYKDYVVVAGSDGNLYYTSPTGSSFTLIGALSGSSPPNFVEFNDKLIIASGDKLQSWDGTTFTTIDTSPKAKLVGVNEYGTRLIASGDSDNPDRVWFSGLENEEMWDPNDSENPALYEDVLWKDGSQVKAIATLFNDVIVFKGDNPASIVRLHPVSGTAFQHSVLARNFRTTLDHTAVVGDDIYFLDENGLHSLKATMKYGEFELDPFIASAVQECFRDNNTIQLMINRDKAQLWAVGDKIVVFHIMTGRFTTFDFGLDDGITWAYYDKNSGHIYIATGTKLIDYTLYYKYDLPATLKTKVFVGADPAYYEVYREFNFDIEPLPSVSGSVKVHKVLEEQVDPTKEPYIRNFSYGVNYTSITTPSYYITQPSRLITTSYATNPMEFRFRQLLRAKRMQIELNINQGKAAINKIMFTRAELGRA